MKIASCYLLIALLFISCTNGQKDTDYTAAIKNYQYEMNVRFADKETSILKAEDFKGFSSLDFFPIDSNYRVKAKFTRTPDETPRIFPTSSGSRYYMLKYGEALFELQGKSITLDVFQTEDLKTDRPNYLFIPFTDLTSGNETYGGGRYVDADLPNNDQLIIDFNKTYNPYCAYNDDYSCVLPPRSNRIPIEIKVGIKNFKKREH